MKESREPESLRQSPGVKDADVISPEDPDDESKEKRRVDSQLDASSLCLKNFGCPTGIRTPTDGTRNRRPTVRPWGRAEKIVAPSGPWFKGRKAQGDFSPPS